MVKMSLCLLSKLMAVITINKNLHSKLKKACKNKGVKIGYAAEQAVGIYLSNFFDKGSSTQSAHKAASK